jgi:hypothetical protein
MQLDNITLQMVFPSLARIAFSIYILGRGLGEILDLLEPSRNSNDVIF